MKELVKYHNHINEVNFNGYTEKELNLFFSLIFMAKDTGTNELDIPFNELKKICDGDKNRDRFIKNIINVNEKLIKLNHKIKIGSIIHIFSLFNRFSIDTENNKLIIQINDIFSYLLNDLIGNFTKFDLKELISLKSIYSKNLFRLLKQWESVKSKEFTIEEIREILGVPSSYTSTNFNERVLKPILNELPTYFCNFKMEKIKTGRKVTSIKFTWESKKEIGEKVNKEIEILEISISDKLNKVIEKAKRNRYLTKLLNVDNIEKLLKSFEEKDLIKGLNFAYSEVNQEIKSLNYLVKTIKTGISKKERKLVIEKPIIENKETFEEDKKEENEKVKITRDEYELLYKIYLKENKISNNKLVRKGFELFNKDKYEVI